MDICGKPVSLLINGDSNPGTITLSPGGVARNIAENLARLGVDCHLLSVIGQDQFADRIFHEGIESGINMDAVLRIENEPTSTYLSVLDESGDMSVAVNDMTVIDYLTPEYLDQHMGLVKNAAAVVADTNMPIETFNYLTSNMGDRNLIVDAVSSVKAERIKSYLSSISILKVNKVEAQAMSEIMSADLEKIANWFHGQGVDSIYITLGPDGVFYSGADITGTQKQIKDVHVKNANGAGDAFVAGVAYGTLTKWKMDKVAKFAICAATVAVAHSETINPTMSVARINKLMETNYEL